MINPFQIAAVVVSLNNMRRVKEHGLPPSLEDPTQTLIPRQEHPRRQFVPTIKIADAYGKDSHFDECGNRVDPNAETERIARLSPRVARTSEWVVVYAIFAVIFVLGTIAGFFISHF